ncbi:endonuclease III [Candidatus Peregrinibacteria bacterium]|nr:MAG: endonuclease III [Candidatus Peregrinibacteria bacterium]
MIIRSSSEKSARIQESLKRLKKTFPQAKCALLHRNVYELFVAVQLSAQCTDERVNQISPALFQKVPDFSALASISQEELEQLIYSTGFYRNKAKNLRGAAQHILKRFSGKIPHSLAEMITLPGIARKSANVILETAFGIVEGIVVDTHVKRITKLLRITESDNAERIERELMEYIPRKKWGDVGHLLVALGRAICIAHRPQCHLCPLADICPSSQAGVISSRKAQKAPRKNLRELEK